MSVAFAPDGRSVASADAGGEVVVWDVDGKGASITLAPPTGPLYSLAYAPDGAALAAGGDGTVTLWDLARENRSRTFPANPGSIRSLAFSPDGLLLAAAGADATDHALGRPLGSRPGHPPRAHRVGPRRGLRPGRPDPRLLGRRGHGPSLGSRRTAGSGRPWKRHPSGWPGT